VQEAVSVKQETQLQIDDKVEHLSNQVANHLPSGQASKKEGMQEDFARQY